MKYRRTLGVLRSVPVLASIWLLVGLSGACTPELQSTELKAYRADIVIDGNVRLQGNDVLVTVTKTLKGDLGGENEILVTGFGTEEPCFLPNSELSENTEYMFYLSEDMEGTIDGQNSRTFLITANPDEADRTLRRKVQKVVQKGAPPVFDKQLRDRRVLEGDKVTIKCLAGGLPEPLFSFTKDGQLLDDRGAIRGVQIKHLSTGMRLRIKKADKLLHEGTYECIADNGADAPVTTSLRLSICALDCGAHGELRAKKCICSCEEGWTGPQCDISIQSTTTLQPFVPTCDIDCGTNGFLNEELCICTCNKGFKGELCTDPEVCNITCGDHGTRNNDTCTCTCQIGYYGDRCTETPTSLCLQGSYCHNEGVCSQCLHDGTCNPVNETIQDNPDISIKCICTEYYMGDRCQYHACPDISCDHGRLDISSCSCICNQGYRGERCHVVEDTHTTPCDNSWNGYCLNGGVCFHLSRLNKPSCRCSSLYIGDRCDLLDPDVTCYPGFCLNGGKCSYEADGDPCICGNTYGGDRCQFLRPGQIITCNSSSSSVSCSVDTVSRESNPSSILFPVIRSKRSREDGVIVQTHYAHARFLLTITELDTIYDDYYVYGTKTDSKKLIVTMTAIFVFMMIVIAIVVFIYIKNRSAREKEHRERFNEKLKEQANAYIHDGTEDAVDIQMRSFLNTQPETTSIHMENDTHPHLNPNPLSRPIRNNNEKTTPPPYPGFISLNGSQDAKASIHSNNNSATYTNSNHSSPQSDHPPPPQRRDGYEEIPGDDPSEVEMSTTATPVHSPGRGDPDTLPTQQSQSQGSSSSDTSDSCDSDTEGDTIDIPNPQIQAIENHIATSECDNSSGDYTWDEYNQNIRFTNPYAMDSSPVHMPLKQRSRLNGHSSPQHVNILANPIENGAATGATRHSNLSSSPKNNIYNDKLKDVVENSPASAV